MRIQRLFFRPSKQPTATVPLGARSVGHYATPPHHRDGVMVKHFVQFFWGVEGTGALCFDGVERKLRPGQIALYLPGMEHRVYAIGEPWEYRWFTLDGPQAVGIVAGFGFTEAGIFEGGPVPVDLFEKLAACICENTHAGERRASAAAYALLAHAAGQRTSAADPLTEQALLLLQERWADPALNVKALARALRVNRSVLCRQFKATTGVTPSQYLIRVRLQNALTRLKQTRQPVHTVARQCGFDDPNYFARCVRRKLGMTPREFRSPAG